MLSLSTYIQHNYNYQFLRMSKSSPKTKIVNVEELEGQSPQATQIMNNILASHNLNAIRNNANQWIYYLYAHQYPLDQLLIKVNQKQIGRKTEYEMELFPKFKRFSIGRLITNKSIDLMAGYSFFSEARSIAGVASWNFLKQQMKYRALVMGDSPWVINAQLTKGKPLNQMWVTDCRRFKLNYIFNRQEESEWNNKFFMRWKGYSNRVKSQFMDQNNIFAEKQWLKKIDLIETGFVLQKQSGGIDNSSSFRIKMLAGTDLFDSRYLKLKTAYNRLFPFGERRGVRLEARAGHILGNQLPPQQLFSRNQTKWMGERSQSFLSLRGALLFYDIPFMAMLNIAPLNYLKVILSKNPQNKLKLEGELGIGFQIKNTMFKMDFSLFRIAGTRGQPKFGIKYEF